jgi:ABC-2 type transport system permease protein
MKFYLCLLATSIRASMALRGSFLFEMGLMLVNNLIFFSLWLIFFQKFQAIGGWGQKEMTLLLALGMGSYGLLQICFGGTRQLARIICSGDLDTFLTQPRNVLLHIAGSKSAGKGWGHLLSAFVLLAFGGFCDLATLLLVLLALCTGSMVFTSIRVIGHSLAFWFGPIDALSEKYADSLFLFANYPTNIYTDALQILMFTILPAGLISYLPVELIRHFSLMKMVVLLISAASFALMAFFVFYRGLKRYESGNHFGLRL